MRSFMYFAAFLAFAFCLAQSWVSLAPSPFCAEAAAAPGVTLHGPSEPFAVGVPVQISVAFSEVVEGFTQDDILLGGAPCRILSLEGAGALYNLSLLPEDVGRIGVQVPARCAIGLSGAENLESAILPLVPEEPIDTSLRLHLRLEETRGIRAFDSSLYGHDAQFGNPMLYLSGGVNTGLSFATQSIAGPLGRAIAQAGAPEFTHLPRIIHELIKKNLRKE